MAEVVKKEASQVVALDQSILEADSGLGNKEVDQDTLSIPFLKTNLSKQILEANRGAVSGDMIEKKGLRLYLVYSKDALSNGLHLAMSKALLSQSTLLKKNVLRHREVRKIIKNI